MILQIMFVSHLSLTDQMTFGFVCWFEKEFFSKCTGWDHGRCSFLFLRREKFKTEVQNDFS